MLLVDARIDERRAPVTHPELIPGLAQASDTATAELIRTLGALCASSESVSVAPAEIWEDASFSAYSYRVSGSRTDGCSLIQQTVTVSVALPRQGRPIYALRSTSPETTTPIGDCDVDPTWREESVLDGELDRVRLVLVVDRTRGEVRGSQVVIRSATATGWTEDVLVSPAPSRYIGRASGPLLTLAETGSGGAWVVAHSARVVDGGGCTPTGEQTVWRASGSVWTPTTGREAQALLGRRGLWRYAASDGWLHIVLQDNEGHDDVLALRAKRLQRRYPEVLRPFASSDLPGLNPGFTVMAPAPFQSEQAAQTARRAWRSMHRHYVKRAWTAQDPCEGYGVAPEP